MTRERLHIMRLRAAFDAAEAKHGRDIAIETILELDRKGRGAKPVPRHTPAMAGAVKEIARAIGKRFGLSIEDIHSNSHLRMVSEARQELFFELRQIGYSLSTIGSLVGGRHHSTVLRGLQMRDGRPRGRKPRLGAVA